MNWLIILLLWIATGVFGAGIFYAYFQGEYPDACKRRQDLVAAILWGASGPFGVIDGIFLSRFLKHGWRLK